MRTRGDVEKNHLIRALLVVADGKLHWVAHIPQLARLGLSELHTTGHLLRMHIQTWYDSLRQHRAPKPTRLREKITNRNARTIASSLEAPSFFRVSDGDQRINSILPGTL